MTMVIQPISTPLGGGPTSLGVYEGIELTAADGDDVDKCGVGE
jgi:hypothetical protein